MPTWPVAARDGEELAHHDNGQDWIVSWHPPPVPPAGTPHGAAGICLTGDGEVVLIKFEGRWEIPAGRPEGDETWEETLRREMMEEACVAVIEARLLGFSRGQCIRGDQEGQGARARPVDVAGGGRAAAMGTAIRNPGTAGDPGGRGPRSPGVPEVGGHGPVHRPSRRSLAPPQQVISVQSHGICCAKIDCATLNAPRRVGIHYHRKETIG